MFEFAGGLGEKKESAGSRWRQLNRSPISVAATLSKSRREGRKKKGAT